MEEIAERKYEFIAWNQLNFRIIFARIKTSPTLSDYFKILTINNERAQKSRNENRKYKGKTKQKRKNAKNPGCLANTYKYNIQRADAALKIIIPVFVNRFLRPISPDNIFKTGHRIEFPLMLLQNDKRGCVPGIVPNIRLFTAPQRSQPTPRKSN